MSACTAPHLSLAMCFAARPHFYCNVLCVCVCVQCYVESSLSAVLKPAGQIIDLKHYSNKNVLRHTKDVAKQYRDARKACEAGRNPPQLPETVAAALQTKVFQAKSDSEVVARLYFDFFYAVAPRLASLLRPKLQWGASQAQELAVAMPHFDRCHTLDVSGNPLGVEGAKRLAASIRDHNSLKQVS